MINMKLRKLLALSVALLLLGISLAPSASASEAEALVSPGISIIASKSGMSKAGLCGSELKLSRDDFARALNLSRVSSITLESVPPAEDGELRVGNTVLKSGQTVNGSNISLMTFVSKTDTLTKTSFTFREGQTPYAIECSLYLLDELNYAPSVSLASAVSLNLNTYENISCYGKLSAYDPDSDECFFEIVDRPVSGIVVLSEENAGEYLYIPTKSFVGKDSFTYVARDKYGNYSPSAKVNIKVERAALSAYGGFDDMKDSKAHSSAIRLSEEGIMSGTRIGEGYYFRPDEPVSRAEFVVLAMQALGIRDVSSIRTSGFYDDGDIPESMRGYVSAARELDYVSGSYVDGKLCFLPNEKISRAEAAVIVGRMLDVATPVLSLSLEDAEDIPTWAESAVYALSTVGVLDSDNGLARPCELMSRADTARMLCAMMVIYE